MHASRRILLTVVAIPVVAAAGCGDLAVINEERSDQHSFEFHHDRLVIENRGSDLRIVTGDPGSVEVARTLTGKASQGDHATVSLAEDTLTLQVVCSGLVINCHAHHIVSVPPGLDVEVDSPDGPVRAVGLAGDLTATVHDWLRVEGPAGTLELTAGLNLKVTDARTGEVVATSTGGDVVLAFAEPPDQVEARSRHGDVRITLPDGSETYRIEATNHYGTVATSLTSDPDSDRRVIAEANRQVEVRMGKA